MKLLLIPDLHGRKPLIPKEEFDAIVCIGDICSDKGRRALTKQWFRYLEKNPDKKISDDAFIIKKIGRKGMLAMDRKSLEEGNKLLKYLDSFGKPIFFVPGNWDQCYGPTRIKDPDKSKFLYLKTFYDYWLGDKLNKKLIKGVKNLVNCQYMPHSFMGFNFIGYGLSSAFEDIKMRKKDSEFTKKQIYLLQKSFNRLIKKLDDSYAKRKDKSNPAIFLTHNVPYGTKLDTLVNKKSKLNGKHLGSTVARQFCIRHKPLLCVGGHMHEHFGKVKLSKTVCINVGFGENHATIVDLEKNKIKNIKFIGKANV